MGQRWNQTLSLLRKDALLKGRFKVAYVCTLISQSLFGNLVTSIISCLTPT